MREPRVLRKELESRESQTLAPYAMKSAESGGRRHPEPEADYRLCFQRDRDRVIHCKAFRRLEYKTQVFLNHEGDHYRTRLTHTIEVTQISRTIARALGLNEDLTEAVALAHDVGHTPFGHSGEETLKRLMAGCGGFEHNAQGLRVVDLLEQQYPAYRGLNLTAEVRECIIKHATRWDSPAATQEFGAGPPVLEGQAVIVADSIAYDNHDLLDGLEAGILSLGALREVALWREAEEAVRGRWSALSEEQLAKQSVRYLVNLFVTGAIETGRAEIERRSIASPRDATAQEGNVVSFGEELSARKDELEDFLYSALYRDYRVMRVTYAARRFIEGIFGAYEADPRQLPPQYQQWAEEVGLKQAICDYVAGMTDRYAQDTYTQLFLPYQKL
jgi:dGTPase